MLGDPENIQELYRATRQALIARARKACPENLRDELESMHPFWVRMDYVNSIIEWENPGTLVSDVSAVHNMNSMRSLDMGSYR